MPRQRSVKPTRKQQSRTASAQAVFLNVPYDDAFENLFLAYIAAVSAFGFTPRATLEIPSSKRRLDRILALIADCEYSVHDLSRVQLDNRSPRTPRFNMAFELGLTVALERTEFPEHAWVVCESRHHRIQKSLSDLNGTDPYIHDGTIRGVFRVFGSIFVRSHRQPTVPQMRRIYRALRLSFDDILDRAGESSAFNARVFRDLCVLASATADQLVKADIRV